MIIAAPAALAAAAGGDLGTFNLPLLAALSAAGSMYFLVSWLTARKAFKTMTRVERSQAKRDADISRARRRRPGQVIDDMLHEIGYRGDRAPVAVGTSATYLTVVLVAIALGLNGLVAATVSVPLLVGLLYGVRMLFRNRQKLAFAFQLKQLFDLLRGQLEAGYGTQRALEMVTPNLPNPLRDEFQEALDSTRANKDLLDALDEVRQRFPSRGFDLFLAALEVDREQGGSLSATLKRASEMLQREFDLNHHAHSQLASAKQTFWGVLSILLGIAGYQLSSGDATQQEAYFSFGGWMVLIVGAALVASGVYRATRLFRSAGGNL